MRSKLSDVQVVATSTRPVQPRTLPATVLPTYGQILKSTAMIGGSSMATIALGIVRTKAMALLLGPAGVGLLGLYASIADLTQSLAGMGINKSGVRQIAEAVGSGDAQRIARTVTVLRKISFLLGVLGAGFVVTLSGPISTLTFGGSRHAGWVALLSLTVLFRSISDGQAALIHGMRRIPDLAMLTIWGAVFGTIISIPTIYFLGQDGVVPSLIGVAATAMASSWWYSRKVRIKSPSMTTSQLGQEATSLFRLGVAFLATGLMTMSVAYVVRITVLREVGFEAAGFYQAAWAVGALYVGLLLQAMGTDFYPRLTAVATDNVECNRMVNEQAHVSLLLAGPGVVATVTLAPMVITLLYSGDFAPAVGLLRWICLGMTLRVIIWPIGFIILAKGDQKLFFLADLAWTLIHVGLAWIFVRSYGLNGAGIAFTGSYIFHGFLVYPLVRRLSGFRWSAENKRTGLLLLSVIAIVFCGFQFLPPTLAMSIGGVACILSGWYSARTLLALVPSERIPHSMLRLFGLFGLAPSGAR